MMLVNDKHLDRNGHKNLQEHKKARPLIVCLVTLVILMVSFGTLEILTRTLFPDRGFDPELVYSNGPMERQDEELGWVLNPRIHQRVITPAGQTVTYKTNAYGFRIPESEDRETNDHSIDVLFVGDSATFGTGARTSYPEEFATISKLRVANAGVPGYGTDQAFLSLKKIIETYGLQPNVVVYGFFQNDPQNNVSSLSIHGEPGTVIHKPILDLRTGQYRKAEYWKNDVSVRYRKPGLMDAFLVIGSQSRFLQAAGRVIKYDLIASGQTRSRFEFDQSAKEYLKGNLDQFTHYLRSKRTRFVLLQIAGAGQPDLEKQLVDFLTSYCLTRNVQYLRPELDSDDYLPRDIHLSEKGARRMADALWKELQ